MGTETVLFQNNTDARHWDRCDVVCVIPSGQAWIGSLHWCWVPGAAHVKDAVFDISVTSCCLFYK